MLYYFQIFCFSKEDNKYNKGKIYESDIKQGKQFLAQLEANMVKAKVFELLQSEKILLYSEDNSRVSSISSKNEDNNIESIIENNEEDV